MKSTISCQTTSVIEDEMEEKKRKRKKDGTERLEYHGDSLNAFRKRYRANGDPSG